MSWTAQDHDTEWPFEYHATRFDLNPESTALLVVDMQAGDMVKDTDDEYGQKYPHVVEYWNSRIADTIIPNTQTLLGYFREHGLRVVYTRNGAVTPHGEEVTTRLKARKKRGSDRPSDRYRGAPAYEVAEAIYPTEDELVVDKLTSSAFHNTMLDHALRNLGITDVVITGVLTDMCILGTARVASELGYNALIAEDACGTLTQRAHDEALLMHARVFGRVSTTDDVIADLEQADAVRAELVAKE
jgi:ureidoacrylate peracid hydrolase